MVCRRLSVDTDEGEDEQLPRRKISSETVTQHLDSWSYNLLDLFGDGSRKGSVSNLQPLGMSSLISAENSKIFFIQSYRKYLSILR